MHVWWHIFVVNTFCMKLFKTNFIVKLCQQYFSADLRSIMIEKCRKTFLACLQILEKPGISSGVSCHYVDVY